MNYRHAFHAGNFADVLKHATLALVIDYLKRKDAPFRVIDTHAGAGAYDLGADEARRTGEWQGGIGRILGTEGEGLSPEAKAALAPYCDAIRSFGWTGATPRYPGSPALSLLLMRPQDRLVANELHPVDAATLADEIGGDARAKVMAIDGWLALKALLPPKERRGVVLIDPPFEAAGELERLVTGLSEAVRRFATGTYLMWLPVKDIAAVGRFKAALKAAGYEKLLWAELHVGKDPEQPGKLSGTALAILNPPFTLEDQLAHLLPALATVLARGDGAQYRLEWLNVAR